MYYWLSFLFISLINFLISFYIILTILKDTILFLKNVFIYFGCSGSSLRHAGSRVRGQAVQHVGSVVAVRRLSSCGMWDLSSLTRDQTWVPLRWEHRVSTTRPPGKSPKDIILILQMGIKVMQLAGGNRWQ